MASKFLVKYESNAVEKEVIVDFEKLNTYTRKISEKGGKVIAKTKLYPFNMNKHDHDIQLYYNTLWNRHYDLIEKHKLTEEEKREMERLEAKMEEIDDLRAHEYYADGSWIAWFTGKHYGIAKEAVFCAKERRANTCINLGRYDLLKYV